MIITWCTYVWGEYIVGLGRWLSSKEHLLLSPGTSLVPRPTSGDSQLPVPSFAEGLILSSRFCGHPHTHGIEMKIKLNTHNKTVHCFPQIMGVHYCSCHCDKIHEKQCKERRACFHSQWTGKAVRAWEAAHIHSQAGSRERQTLMLRGLPPSSHFTQSRVSVLEMVLATLKVSHNSSGDHSGNCAAVPRDVSPGWFWIPSNWQWKLTATLCTMIASIRNYFRAGHVA